MPGQSDDQNALQQAIAKRAREFAADNHRLRPYRYRQHIVALICALLVVALVFLAFDTFLASMQKLLGIIAAEPTPTAPVPVYIVPEPASGP